MGKKKKSRRRRYSYDQEAELAQESLYGYKGFLPTDDVPQPKPGVTGFERALDRAYIDGWKLAQDEYQSEQRRLDTPAKTDSRPATERQLEYLDKLIREHQISWSRAQDQLRIAGYPTPPDGPHGLMLPQASALIDWLKEFPLRQCEATTKAGSRCKFSAQLLRPNCSTHAGKT